VIRRKGFTLLEVVVAVTVGIILMTCVATVTRSMVELDKRQKTNQRAGDRLARTIELVRSDWRARSKLVPSSPPGQSDATTLRFWTTAAAGLGEGIGSTTLVAYDASSLGLRRTEGDQSIILIDGPVGLEFWDGATWVRNHGDRVLALRLSFGPAAETLVFR
jgi:prepilin-type N-terminal cleavage/methylation domain-containing protein